MPLYRELKNNLDKYCSISGTQASLQRLKKVTINKETVIKLFKVAFNYLVFGNAADAADSSKRSDPIEGGNTGESNCSLEAFGLLAGHGNSYLKLTTGVNTLKPKEELVDANTRFFVDPPVSAYNPELSMYLFKEFTLSGEILSGTILKPGYFYNYQKIEDKNYTEYVGFEFDPIDTSNISYWYNSYGKDFNAEYKYNFNFNGLTEYQYNFGNNTETYYNRIKLNSIDSTVYLYSTDGTGTGWSKLSASLGSVSAGYGGSWEGEGSMAILGNLSAALNGSKRIGLGYRTNYNYFFLSSLANSDNMLFAIGNSNNQNYISLYADGGEASIWTYDNYGTSLLWNTRSEGKFHLYNDISFFQISVDSAYGESAFWGMDEQHNSIVWNSKGTGILGLWHDYISNWIGFYSRGEASFWFSNGDYTDLKFSSILGLLQLWNNDRQSYIDLSVYDMEEQMACKLRYVKCKGRYVIGKNGQNIMVLSSDEIDICNPQTSSVSKCSADSVIHYNDY